MVRGYLGTKTDLTIKKRIVVMLGAYTIEAIWPRIREQQAILEICEVPKTRKFWYLCS